MFSNFAVLSDLARQRRRVAGRCTVIAVVALGTLALFPSAGSAAQAPVGLGTATSFAVLAGEGITNANATTIVGDVGTFPNPAQTGFGSVTLTGTNHHGDAVTQKAKDDLVTAYNQAAGAGPPTSVAVELGGRTLTPGVYNGATLEITGTLTLDTGGDPNAVFIFQSGSTLITAANSAVRVLNGGTACNVFWKVPSSATLGTNSELIGSVLASTAIAAKSGATVRGRLLAQTASVTLDNNTITTSVCAAATTTTVGTGGSTTTTPSPTTTTTTAGIGDSSSTVPGVSPATSPPGTPSAPQGSTPSRSPGIPTSRLFGSPTPGIPTTRLSGSPTPGATPPASVRPPLARTGFDGLLPLLGASAVALGLTAMGLSKVRHGSRR